MEETTDGTTGETMANGTIIRATMETTEDGITMETIREEAGTTTITHIIKIAGTTTKAMDKEAFQASMVVNALTTCLTMVMEASTTTIATTTTTEATSGTAEVTSSRTVDGIRIRMGRVVGTTATKARAGTMEVKARVGTTMARAVKAGTTVTKSRAGTTMAKAVKGGTTKETMEVGIMGKATKAGTTTEEIRAKPHGTIKAISRAGTTAKAAILESMVASALTTCHIMVMEASTTTLTTITMSTEANREAPVASAPIILYDG